MDRSNLGFAVFLVLLLLAPSVPVPGLAAAAGASPAAAGLIIWFMLASRLPLRAVLTMPTVLALIGFSVYALLVSLASGQLVSIMYALQYGFYTTAGGALIAAYLVHKLRQGRELEAWRILAWVGAIYAAGIIVSYWTGPIWSVRGPGGKQYESLLIIRARGFSDSVNAAGGIAALFAAFHLFLYPSSRLRSGMLAALSFTAMVLTLSRSAIIAFALAISMVAALLVFRAIFLRGKVGPLRLRLVPIGFILIGLVVGVVSSQQPMVVAAWERLIGNEEYLDRDIEWRLRHWGRGAERWTELSPTQQMIGEGFRTGDVWSTGAYATAHNSYIEFLSEFGIIGLLMFVSILAASVLRSTWLILSYRDNPLTRFSCCGVMVLIIHNLTEVFFYDIATLIWLIVLLTCNELAGRRWAAPISGASRAAGPLLPGLPGDNATPWRGPASTLRSPQRGLHGGASMSRRLGKDTLARGTSTASE